MPELHLVPDTRESCHAFFRRLVQDPALFGPDAPFVPYRYDSAAVDARFDALQNRRDKKSYALLLEDAVIGNVELKHIDAAARSCEIGICLTDDSVKNRSYGTEALRLARRIAFEELGMERVTAKCLPTNRRSLRMLEKAGFRHCGETGGFITFEYLRRERKTMKFISWNVNGLRAARGKGFEDVFRPLDADFFCLQETKLQAGQIDLSFPGYESYWSYAEKKGYSGTAIFTKHTPLSVRYNLGIPEHDTEGRAVTLEYENFFLVCVYTPNAQDGLKRLDYRMRWEDDFRAYLCALDRKKPVIVCGDMNVAHEEIDLKNPKQNVGNAGFSDEERGKFTELLAAGFTDSFRFLYPDKTDAYSWWSYRAAARQRNVGWRIDYFVISDRLRGKVRDAYILPDIQGSDHCPVGLELSTDQSP